MTTVTNKVQLIGRLGKDPELRTTTGGKKVASFTMATSEDYKNAKGEWVTDTQWHQIVAWNALADLAETKLKKGIEVMLEGKIQTRDYIGKDGLKRYITEITARDIHVVEK